MSEIGKGAVNDSNRTLFSPFSVGDFSLSNRIVMAPMTRGQNPDHVPTPEVARYYRRRAEGGAGLIITECAFIDHPTANGFPGAPAFHGEKALAGWRRVVDEVHEAGGRIMPQIWHAGAARQMGMSPNGSLPGIGPVDRFEEGRRVVRGMTEEDIGDVVAAFGEAAAHAKAIGFDGVEIHGAHSYLIDQFLWRQSNRRTDAYGGSLENRVRLAREIVAAVRAAVGEGFPVLFRFSQWKLEDYEARIASSPRELEQILLPLVDAGVDVFHASTRRFWRREFPESELSLAGWVKKITGKAVIAVGGIGIDRPFSLDIFSGNTVSQPRSVEVVEEKLQNGEFDLVAVGRALLADPDWPSKVESGQLGEVIPFSSKSLEIFP